MPVLVPQGAILYYPVSDIKFAKFSRISFAKDPRLFRSPRHHPFFRIPDPLPYSSQLPSHTIIRCQVIIVRVIHIMNLYTYVPPKVVDKPQACPTSHKPQLYTYVPPTLSNGYSHSASCSSHPPHHHYHVWLTHPSPCPCSSPGMARQTDPAAHQAQPQPCTHPPQPCVQAAEPYVHHHWHGGTRAQVDAENMAIAANTGATKPHNLAPYKPSPSQQWWCRELDGSYTLRNTQDIMDNLQPGFWQYAQPGGYPYFIRQEKEKK